MKLQVLGTGCAKCTTLLQNTKSAVAQLGLQAEVLKVTEVNEIVRLGVMLTPALAAEGEVLVSGRVPEVAEICELLRAIPD